MLIDFAVENFRSYRERKQISFIASGTKESAPNLAMVPELDLALVRSAATVWT